MSVATPFQEDFDTIVSPVCGGAGATAPSLAVPFWESGLYAFATLAGCTHNHQFKIWQGHH